MESQWSLQELGRHEIQSLLATLKTIEKRDGAEEKQCYRRERGSPVAVGTHTQQASACQIVDDNAETSAGQVMAPIKSGCRC